MTKVDSMQNGKRKRRALKDESVKRLPTMSIKGIASLRRRKIDWTNRTLPQQLKTHIAKQPPKMKTLKRRKPVAKPPMSMPSFPKM